MNTKLSVWQNNLDYKPSLLSIKWGVIQRCVLLIGDGCGWLWRLQNIVSTLNYLRIIRGKIVRVQRHFSNIIIHCWDREEIEALSQKEVPAD